MPNYELYTGSYSHPTNTQQPKSNATFLLLSTPINLTIRAYVGMPAKRRDIMPQMLLRSIFKE